MRFTVLQENNDAPLSVDAMQLRRYQEKREKKIEAHGTNEEAENAGKLERVEIDMYIIIHDHE